ncbi:hypothetical protein DSO57_1011486 [Entomophthora muscae]|uniref:Uncharacterized protein n=1 Tax=Entomophthora muscae TaxID=34485 RepID=A0ACC2RXE2_9FUNG|nr:hypothetical protein DSO57_1011486 [Entomophthora muscae]
MTIPYSQSLAKIQLTLGTGGQEPHRSVATRGSTTPIDPPSQPLLAKNPCNYNIHKVETLDVLQVHSDTPVLQASHSLNKVTCLAYPFCFCGNTHKLLIDTRADYTMVDQAFADLQQLDRVPSRFKAVQVADSHRVTITHKTVTFSVRMGNVQVKLSGPIMAGLSHNVIAGLDWPPHNCPYIN